jgi:hypothetical protein
MFVPDVAVKNIEFRVLWECQRWSLTTGLPIERFLGRIPVGREDYETFMEALKSATKPFSNITLPSRSNCLTWQRAKQDAQRSSAQYNAQKQDIPERGMYEVQYKARISFSDSKDSPHLFQTTLLALYSDKSCRFQRRYGSHRVLYVDVPDFKKLPKHFNGQEHLLDMFLNWLCTPKQFLGRTWLAIHLEASKAKKTDAHRFLGYRVVLLALSGDGLEPLDVSLVFHQFMRLEDQDNMMRPFRKLFSRIDLGFSKTIASIAFRPSQVIFIDDIYADDTPESEEYRDVSCDWTQQAHLVTDEGRNMTDGCSVMSVAAMRAIWSKMGRSGALPAAMQGRIGGAKGVWARSGPADSKDERDLDIWIEIRRSQVKFEVPKHDTDDDKFDEFQWTFEISSMTESHGHETLCGSLHLDMIPLLVNCGVPLPNIEEVMKEALVGQDEKVSEILDNALETLYWVEKRDGDRENRKEGIDDETDGQIPIGYAAKAKYLLEHGFEPKQCAYLAETIRVVAKDHFSKAIQSMDCSFYSKMTC